MVDEVATSEAGLARGAEGVGPGGEAGGVVRVIGGAEGGDLARGDDPRTGGVVGLPEVAQAAARQALRELAAPVLHREEGVVPLEAGLSLLPARGEKRDLLDGDGVCAVHHDAGTSILEALEEAAVLRPAGDEVHGLAQRPTGVRREEADLPRLEVRAARGIEPEPLPVPNKLIDVEIVGPGPDLETERGRDLPVEAIGGGNEGHAVGVPETEHGLHLKLEVVHAGMRVPDLGGPDAKVHLHAGDDRGDRAVAMVEVALASRRRRACRRSSGGVASSRRCRGGGMVG